MSIRVETIKKSYGDTVVFDGYSCEFKEGVWSAVTGNSGIGKTTLLRILLELESVDGGKVSGIPKKKSVVFQEHRLCEHMNAYDNIAMVATCEEDELMEGLRCMGIHESRLQPVSELSGGMRRRVELLRAILTDAQLYVFDEPFTGLDAETKAGVIAYCKSRLAGRTVIWVTHHEDEIQDLEIQEIITLS